MVVDRKFKFLSYFKRYIDAYGEAGIITSELPRPQGGASTTIKCTAKPLACLTGKIE
jgi:hypothetical protein